VIEDKGFSQSAVSLSRESIYTHTHTLLHPDYRYLVDIISRTRVLSIKYEVRFNVQAIPCFSKTWRLALAKQLGSMCLRTGP